MFCQTYLEILIDRVSAGCDLWREVLYQNPTPAMLRQGVDVKKFLVLLLASISVALTSCATSATKMNRIHIGMSKTEVIAVLDDPIFAEANGKQETLVFNLSESRVWEAGFGGVMRGANIGKNHYRVVLVDDKVTAFYRAEAR